MSHYHILKDAFEQSAFLHSVGSGNEQALDILLESISYVDDEDWDQRKIDIVAGAIAAMALIGYNEAVPYAEQIIEGSQACEFCGEMEATEVREDDSYPTGQVHLCEEHAEEFDEMIAEEE